MSTITAKQILKEIYELSPIEKDNLLLLLDKKLEKELINRMNTNKDEDLSEEELFEGLI